jgi:hypothetical protein
MIWVTDLVTGNKVAINPDYVVAVFIAAEGPSEGNTIINLTTGQLAVKESDVEVVSAITAH